MFQFILSDSLEAIDYYCSFVFKNRRMKQAHTTARYDVGAEPHSAATAAAAAAVAPAASSSPSISSLPP